MATDTIHRPSRARSHIIERPRITRLLDETKARTIMLVAPAGFGKTTLARQWLDLRPHGWYRGSPASADVAALAAGVARAAAEIVPGAGKRMMERLGIVGAPPPKPEVLAGMLGDDLVGWPAEAWVAVDDYQFAMTSAASETFVEELIVRSPVRLFVTSRTRPSWATARRMLYGEIFEVGRSALALTHDEARQVLADRKVEEVAGLMALTEGWPAVIGLASLSTEPVVSEAQLPDTLYEYCAEELFQRFPRELRAALCTIALVPSVSTELLRDLFGERAPAVAHAAEEGGFVTRGKGGDLDMHPLLRTFLLAKLEEEPAERTARVVRDLAAHLVRARQWDDALAVVSRSNDVKLVEELIDSAMDELLSQGRLETLKEWLDHARTLGESPIFDLVDAEVAFREGDSQHAHLQATNAASQLPSPNSRVSRAHYRAAQSSYFLDRSEDAYDLSESALETALTQQDTKNALWSLYNSALELDDRRAKRFLDELAQLRPLTVSDEIRLTAGEAFFAARWGGLEATLPRARAVLKRISGADPMVQTGFLNNYAHALILTSRYEEALPIVSLEASRADEFRLEFALPHCRLLRALALTGLRRFTEARESLAEITAGDDPYVPTAAALFTARLYLFEGQIDMALEAIADASSWTPNSSSLRAEVSATAGLALAVAGRSEEALNACNESERHSDTIEPAVLRAGARAVIALRNRSPSAEKVAADAFGAALEFGNVDSFVCAYRAHPMLLIAVASFKDLESPLWTILQRARDTALARRVLQPSYFSSREWRLTRREREVLDLVARGLTNREIGGKLFISEVTVKVHLRHILRKLGVRTRTEAALLMARAENNTG